MITDFFGSAAKKGAKGKRKLSSTSNLSTTGSASKRLKSSSSAGSASSSMSPLINDEKENGKSGAVGASASGSGAGGAAASPLFNAGDLGDAGWIKAIGREFDRGYFKAIEKELRANELKRIKVYPPREQIFNAFRFCPFEDVRVVIVGQDPYHGPGQAHGLSFSVPDGVAQPPSLRNMIKEAKACCGSSAGSSGNLEKWARQGVLLLNASLTVQHKKANSHAKIGWSNFTDAAIRAVAHKRKGVVFLLWGGFAQKKCKFVDSSRHCVIKCVHPSPLSAYRGFMGSKCFQKANTYLESKGKAPIDWSV